MSIGGDAKASEWFVDASETVAAEQTEQRRPGPRDASVHRNQSSADARDRHKLAAALGQKHSHSSRLPTPNAGIGFVANPIAHSETLVGAKAIAPMRASARGGDVGPWGRICVAARRQKPGGRSDATSEAVINYRADCST